MVNLQSDNRDGLSRSKRTSFVIPGRPHVYTVGELHEILNDSRNGSVVDGRHRKQGGWKAERTIQIYDDLDALVKRLHTTVQRRPTQDEHAELFGMICEQIEAFKAMESADIGGFVRDHISPFEKSYTYALIPNRFKHETSPRGDRVRSSESLAAVVDTSGATFPRAMEPVERERHEVQLCPNCHTALRVTGSGSLQLAG